MRRWPHWYEYDNGYSNIRFSHKTKLQENLAKLYNEHLQLELDTLNIYFLTFLN